MGARFCALPSLLASSQPLRASDAPEATPAPQRVIGVATTPGGSRLSIFDARTLAPVSGGWSRAVRKYVPAALSPSRTRVAAVVPNGGIRILDAATGRHIRWVREPGDSSEGLFWLGGDGTKGSHRELLIAESFGCHSQGCGTEYSVCGTGYADSFNASPVSTAALTEGLVFAFDPTEVYLYGSDDYFGKANSYSYFGIGLARLPKDAPFKVVSDALRHRVFVVSSAGLVAQIENVARKCKVTYHRVPLNGRSFKAAWAGGNRIALLGESGLGTINVGNWTTHHIAPAVTGTVATKFGLAAWTSNPADGVTLYRPDGRMMWRLLEGKAVRSAVTVGDYLYVDADARYSVNLQTGAVFGPVASDVTIVTPDLPRIRQ